MRIFLTAILIVAGAVATVLSIVTVGFYDARPVGIHPLVLWTIALWVIFGLAVLALRKVPRRAAIVLVLVGSVLTGGAAMAGLPNTSTDSARYAWDGIVQNAGISPYAYAPSDPEVEHLRPHWLFPAPKVADDGTQSCPRLRIMKFTDPDTGVVTCTAINRVSVPTIYPPTSEIYFALVRFVAGPAPHFWPLQLAGLLLSLSITALLLRTLVVRGLDPRWAALWGWSPLAATEAVTNSHVDVLGALLLLVATIAVSSSKPWRGGIALGAAIAAKLIPVIGAPALLARQGWKVIVASVATFALLYVPYVLATGIGVIGYLPGYLSEEGYESGDRFLLFSWFSHGTANVLVAGVLVAVTALLVWRRTDPSNPWLGQVVMIGTTLLIVTPRYPWYALLLVPMIAMSGRWEWLLVPLALTQRLLIPSTDLTRISVVVAIILIVAVSFYREGPGAGTRLRQWVRHPLARPKTRGIPGQDGPFRPLPEAAGS